MVCAIVIELALKNNYASSFNILFKKINFVVKKGKVYIYDKNAKYLYKSPQDQSPRPIVWGFL